MKTLGVDAALPEVQTALADALAKQLG